ncbi:hypothetical protein HAX54_044507, partial [Datura stramonium]|nr:hypothetical protein [Datura stramonium]
MVGFNGEELGRQKSGELGFGKVEGFWGRLRSTDILRVSTCISPVRRSSPFDFQNFSRYTGSQPRQTSSLQNAIGISMVERHLTLYRTNILPLSCGRVMLRAWAPASRDVAQWLPYFSFSL